MHPRLQFDRQNHRGTLAKRNILKTVADSLCPFLKQNSTRIKTLAKKHHSTLLTTRLDVRSEMTLSLAEMTLAEMLPHRRAEGNESFYKKHQHALRA